MSDQASIVRRIIRNRSTPLVLFLLLILLTFLIHSKWVNSHEKKFEALSVQLQHYVEETIAKQKKVSDREIQGLINSNPRVVYMVYQNQLDEEARGFLNVKSFDLGAQNLGQYYNQHVTTDVLQKIIQESEQFSSPYIDRKSVV